MIIRYPTSLYANLLRNAGSYIFTISSLNPPISNERILQFPAAELVKQAPSPDFEFPETEFFANVSSGKADNSGSSKKQFESGQILNFGDASDAPEIDDDLVPDTVDLIQNTNILDLDQYDLTEEEVEQLDQESKAKFVEIIADLNTLKTQIASKENEIVENQKSINEVDKIISATLVAIGQGEIVDKLMTKKQELTDQRQQLATDVNVLVSSATGKFNDLVNVRELVR